METLITGGIIVLYLFIGAIVTGYSHKLVAPYETPSQDDYLILLVMIIFWPTIALCLLITWGFRIGRGKN